eukprot:3235577-Prymnesium_polylepis.1
MGAVARMLPTHAALLLLQRALSSRIVVSVARLPDKLKLSALFTRAWNPAARRRVGAALADLSELPTHIVPVGLAPVVRDADRRYPTEAARLLPCARWCGGALAPRAGSGEGRRGARALVQRRIRAQRQRQEEVPRMARLGV